MTTFYFGDASSMVMVFLLPIAKLLYRQIGEQASLKCSTSWHDTSTTAQPSDGNQKDQTNHLSWLNLFARHFNFRID